MESSAPMIDRYVIVPILACLYVIMASPLLIFVTTGPLTGVQSLMTPRPENKIFWTALAVIAVILVVRNWSRLTFPPHIICLFAYLALAGVSILWAFKPEFSLTRFALQATVVISIVLPAMLAFRVTDMMRGVFLCFAFALFVNLFFVFNQTPIMYENLIKGYPGYFTFKGILGECAALALLLSLHEVLYPGRRRMLGIIVIALAVYL